MNDIPLCSRQAILCNSESVEKDKVTFRCRYSSDNNGQAKFYNILHPQGTYKKMLYPNGQLIASDADKDTFLHQLITLIRKQNPRVQFWELKVFTKLVIAQSS